MANPFRLAWAWLTKPSEDVMPADQPVTLTSMPDYLQAEELAELLRHEGIRAETTGNLGLGPGTGFSGYRVLVRAEHLLQARFVLADYEEELKNR